MTNILAPVLDIFKVVQFKADEQPVSENDQDNERNWTSWKHFIKKCYTQIESGGRQGEDSDADQLEHQKEYSNIIGAAKYGMKEGTLTGIFFGGNWGIYKYMTTVFLGGDDKKGSSQKKRNMVHSKTESGNTIVEETMANENIIFVSACNCAIILGLLCTIICTTRASLY